MNGFLWAAVGFAVAGLLVGIASTFWGTDRTTDTHDFGAVVVGLVLLATGEAIAIILAIIGLLVDAV